MSTVGNATKNVGGQIKVFCSDLTVNKLKNYKAAQLPTNAIIISSPQNKDNNDNGNPAVVMTDSNAQVLPLSYSFNSNHFNIDEITNTVSLNPFTIENGTVKSNGMVLNVYKFDDKIFKIKEDNTITIADDFITSIVTAVINGIKEVTK